MSTDDTTGDELTAVPVEDVAAEMVRVMRDRSPGLRKVPASALAEALAEVLPVYGAMVEARTFGHDYERRERDARSLTTRVYGASLLLRLANEADQAARAGTEPAINTTLARQLRTLAHREGTP